MSSCRVFKALGLVNTCGDESPTVPQEPSSGEQELGGESVPFAASELQEGGFTNILTSPTGEFSTFFTNNGPNGPGLYIINNKTKAKSVVYSILNSNFDLFEDINDQMLHVKDGTLYLRLYEVNQGIEEEVMIKILPLGAAADDTCKIKHFVRLTDYGVLIGPPCGSYNTRDFV